MKWRKEKNVSEKENFSSNFNSNTLDCWMQVKAPNKLLYLHNDGTIHVGSSKYKHDGEMIVFHPRKER